MKSLKNTARSALASTLLFLSLTVLCVVLSFLIVLPLWKWASVSPSSYTIAVLILALALIVLITAFFIKKRGVFVFLRRFLKTASILSAVILPVLMLSKGRKITALILFLISLSICAGVSIVFKKIQHN